MPAALLFAIAAVGGLFLATLRLRGKPLPTGVALAHGAAAAAGLIALAVAVFGAGFHAQVPLALFVVAALGGFVLFAFHVLRKPIPVPAMLLHAGVAVVAFALLLVGLLGLG